jgi:hypothetical protein
LIDDDLDRHCYGVNCKAGATPGHTPGPVSVLPDGGEVVAGELWRVKRQSGIFAVRDRTKSILRMCHGKKTKTRGATKNPGRSYRRTLIWGCRANNTRMPFYGNMDSRFFLF